MMTSFEEQRDDPSALPREPEIDQAGEIWITSDILPGIPQEIAWQSIVEALGDPELNPDPVELDGAMIDFLHDTGDGAYYAALTEAVTSCNRPRKGDQTNPKRRLSAAKIVELDQAARADLEPIAFVQDFTIHAIHAQGRTDKSNPALRSADHFFEWVIDEFAPTEPEENDVNLIHDDYYDLILEDIGNLPYEELIAPINRFNSQLDERWGAEAAMAIGRAFLDAMVQQRQSPN